MAKTKEESHYWRSLYIIEVLSEGSEPPNLGDAQEIYDAITTGDCSGLMDEVHEEVSEDRIRELLDAQGSDHSFLIRRERDGEEPEDDNDDEPKGEPECPAED